MTYEERKRQQVLRFINDIKKKHPNEIEDTFMNGYCYWFAQMITKRFNGEIWFNPYICHFAAFVEDRLYDASGMLEDSYGWYNWDGWSAMNQYEAAQIERTIIMKSQITDGKEEE